jgi:hypothetical protein
MLGVKSEKRVTFNPTKFVREIEPKEELENPKISNYHEFTEKLFPPMTSAPEQVKLDPVYCYSALPKPKHRTSTFEELFQYSKQDETNTARFLSQNHLRNGHLSNLYHEIKKGSLSHSEQNKAINDVFSLFKKKEETRQDQTSFIGGRNTAQTRRTEVQNHVEENLDTLEAALKSTEFKKDGIETATDALANFSTFLYKPISKSPEVILDHTQKLFTALLEITKNDPAQAEKAKEYLCKMIESASVLANMEIMLPQEREDAIRNLTLSTENFVNALFNASDMQCEEKFLHPKELFKDAVYLAVLNAGLLMCYEQKGALNKFRLLVKRSFIPFAYICTKAAGAAAGFLSSATGSSLSSIMTGTFASVGAKAGLAATLGAVSVPALFFVGTGLFAIALTYGLYKAGEWARHDLKESLEQKINARQNFLIKDGFKIAQYNKKIAANPREETDDLIRDGFIEKAGSVQNQNGTRLKQNPVFNTIRSSTPKPKDIGAGFKSAPVKKSILPGGLSNRTYQKMEEEYDRLEINFETIHDIEGEFPLIQLFKTYNESIKTAQTSELKEDEIRRAMKDLFQKIKESLDRLYDSKGGTQGVKIGKLISLFHNLINHSERTSTENLIKQTQDIYALAGEIAKDLINSTDKSKNTSDFVKYLQFHIYSAGFFLTINHRSLGAKAKRFASVAMVPACNMLLNTEVMATSSMATALIDAQLSSMIFTASLALGIPFMLLGFAFSFWTARKSKAADGKGIQQLNSTVRDHVKEYLHSEKLVLEEKIRDASFYHVIQKMIWQQELSQIKEKENEMDLNSDDEYEIVTREDDDMMRPVSPELLARVIN